MDLTTTLFGVVNLLGSLVLSKQVGGILLLLGVLRFTVNGDGHYLMFAGLLILLVGGNLTANETDPIETEQPEEGLNHWKVYSEVLNSDVSKLRFQFFWPQVTIEPIL
ncbi:MAG: hypothetical protein ACFFB3_08855 [Candidatus Hodarchaeota archaeon]